MNGVIRVNSFFMSKTKIIHLLCHLPVLHPFEGMTPQEVNTRTPVDWLADEVNNRNIYFFKKDHHTVAAEELLRLTNEFEVECWRPYGNGITRSFTKTIDGVTHRVFPAWEKIIPQVGKVLWSDEIFEEVVSAAKHQKVILNVSVGHAYFHMRLFHMLKGEKAKGLQLAIVALHRSAGFKKFYWEMLPVWKRVVKSYYLLEHWYDVQSLNAVDIYLSGSLVEAKYMEEELKLSNARYFMEGIDFDDFTPLNTEQKIELRKELGLPVDKKIAIAVGNFRSTDYQYQHLIKVYGELKKKRDDILLVMIGGYKSEDLFQPGIDAGAVMLERMPKSELKRYMQASDVFTAAVFDKSFINFGGFGSAMIEALACGMPVLSNNIIHFPGSREERDLLGMDMPEIEDLRRNLIHLLDNADSYTKTRETAKKYFDITQTRTVLYDTYKSLLQ